MFHKNNLYLSIMRTRARYGTRKQLCKCGQPNDRLPQRYCKACHAAYMRANRPRHSELTEEQRKKSNARSYANEYARRGLIEKLPCCVCGDPKSEAHHEDYDKPLEVVWYCREHHLEHHALQNNSA